MENRGGTAGMPILQVLEGKELCNILVIVTRYFGGVLLGTGGLVRAYSEATTKALQKVNYIEKEKGKEAKITVPYSEAESIRYYCRKNNINIIKEEYLENVEILVEISNEMADKMKKDEEKNTIKMTKIDILNEKYVKTNIRI